MLFHILRKDILRKKSITVTLFIFTMLSAALVASGTHMITELSHSMKELFRLSKAPHFVQMHAGELDAAAIENWSDNHPLVTDHQTVEMVSVDGSTITIRDQPLTASNSIMDLLFVTQNQSFDFLLDLNSQVLQVSQGDIAVPIYYMQHHNLQTGDLVSITAQGQNMEFTIVDFVRDVQMNPSIIHSKRFVIHQTDWNSLKELVGDSEYLIEFQLTDLAYLDEFRNAYQSSGLPQSGPAIDYPLFQMLNAITDGIVAVVILLVSLLLIAIALLCIRFTILAVMEEDYREIGVMKAIGIPLKMIQRLYLLKYAVVAASASAAGYLVSLAAYPWFTANIMLYIGTAPKPVWLHLLPMISVTAVSVIVILFCVASLRKFGEVRAVEALRSGSLGHSRGSANVLSLSKSPLSFSSIPIFLGIKDVLGQWKRYAILGFVFLLSSFILIVPVNFLNTVHSPDFINYMGIERSDLRIDLQQPGQSGQDFQRILDHLEADPDIERFSPLVTSRMKAVNAEGEEENLTVEIGDFSIFPLDYLHGTAPTLENEIALSYLNSTGLQKEVGDFLTVYLNGQSIELTVSGIYQDVTNGGRTAKALLSLPSEAVIGYKVSVDLMPAISLSGKMQEYAQLFYPAKVTDLEGYLDQTLGQTIEQLQLLTFLAIAIALFAVILMTTLFLNMLLAKEASQIAIMRSIGFSNRDIRIQYVTRVLLVLGISIVVGTLAANTIGPVIVGALLSLMGAAQLSFTINPLQAYLLCPLALIAAVSVTALLNTVSIRKCSIARMNAE